MKRLVAVGLLMLISSALLGTQDNSGARRSLRGITTINVLVEGLRADALEAGLRQQDFQTDVELRLRQAGLNIESAHVPYMLYINLLVVNTKNPAGLSAVSATLEFVQAVMLKRDPTISLTAAPTWSVDRLVVGPTSNFRSTCRELVRDLVDEFLNAFLEQNPKNQGSYRQRWYGPRHFHAVP